MRHAETRATAGDAVSVLNEDEVLGVEKINATLVNWAHDLGDTTREQAVTTSTIPFIHPHVALIPDAHLEGLGNPMALRSAPHGAGLNFSRSMARKTSTHGQLWTTWSPYATPCGRS